MGLSTYIREIVSAILAIIIIALALTISCQREQLQSHKHTEGELRTQIERLTHALEEERQQAAWEAQTRARDELYVLQMLRDLAEAHAQHANRMQALSHLSTADPAIRDWLDSPVPDAVRELLCPTASGEGGVRESQAAYCRTDPLPIPPLQD